MTIMETLVPVNSKGKPSDLRFSVVLHSREAAEACFRRAAKRLLNPSVWHDLAGWATAHFMHFNRDGVALKRLIAEGDHLRVDIPGLGPRAGNGFDWVIVERVDDRSDPNAPEEWFGFRVRPCAEPGKGRGAIAHFFTDDATSTFIIERKENEVIARYYGRNEVPNNGTDSVLDNIRNSVVALGAGASLSELQWSALCKGLLTDEIGG